VAYRSVQPSFSELRRAERDEVFLRTTIAHAGRRNIEAHLVNISALGFMVRTIVPIAVGEQVLIVLPIVGEVGARVAWSMAGRIGAEFAEPFSAAEYPRLLDALKGRSTTRQFF
jgi:hypothetical protein